MSKLSFPGARAFDTGLAALAALSAGFVAFAMPESLFSSFVAATPLPEWIPAAQPPLGETARLAAVVAAASLTFAAVWGLMAALGRLTASPRPEAEPEAEAQAPKLRRADSHPDAPARRPLLARDLGEPLDLEHFPEAPAEEEPALAEAGHRPLPAFLVPQAPEPVAEDEAEPGDSEPQWDEPQVPWTPSAPGPIALEPEPLPISELAAQLPESEAEPDQSLSQLVNRIEFGLSRKRQALPAGDLPAVEDSTAEQDKVGHRLRSAINDLQKIASTGG